MEQTALQYALRNKLRCTFKPVIKGTPHAHFQKKIYTNGAKDLLLMVASWRQGKVHFGTFISECLWAKLIGMRS